MNVTQIQSISIHSRKTTVSYFRRRNNFPTGIANSFDKHLQILDLMSQGANRQRGEKARHCWSYANVH